MPRCPIVIPEEIRLPLSDGDYLIVKRELNTGEHRHMISEQYKEAKVADGNGSGLTLSLNKMGMNRVLAYVLGWSFVGLDGKPLPFSESALNNCNFDTWQEVLTAVDAHHEQSEREQAARKNAQGSVLAMSATL